MILPGAVPDSLSVDLERRGRGAATVTIGIAREANEPEFYEVVTAALVTPTEAGRAIIDTMFPRQLAIEADLLAPLATERTSLIQALTLLERTLAHHTDP